AVRAFLGWCDRNNIPPAQRLPIPETPEAVPSRPPVRLDDLYVIRNALPIERDRASAAIWACL
ncbi:unnamed protein product, partial [Tilletia controversa]